MTVEKHLTYRGEIKAALGVGGTLAFVTVHPSFLLRVPDDDARAREYHAFVRDLQEVRRLMA